MNALDVAEWSYTKRILIGFMLAPVAPCVAIITAGVLVSGGLMLAPAIFGIILLMLGCYFVTALIALPLFLALWQLYRVNLAICVISGAVIAVAVSLVPVLLQSLNTSPSLISEQLGTCVAIENGYYSACGVQHSFETAGWAGLFGISIAGCFWMIALRRRPQSAKDLASALTSSAAVSVSS